MGQDAQEPVAAPLRHFFISATISDQPWAAWIGKQLEDAGYTTFVEAWDIRPGHNLILALDRALTESERVLLIVSPAMLRQTDIMQPQWASAFQRDPTSMTRRLIPIRVEDGSLTGLLTGLVPINLVGLNESEARARLLEGVLDGRAKPDRVPFPGLGQLSSSIHFPGPSSAPSQGQKQPPRQKDISSISYYSCFIAHAHEDQHFAQRLHNDLETHGVQCWLALRDMKIGARIRPTIDQAIQRQEKLLLICSQHSINSAWVENEVEAALEHERREQREILFPIRLDEEVMYTAQSWAATLRRTRHIGGFTHWTEPEVYKQAFEHLLGDLEKDADVDQSLNMQQNTRLFLPDLEEIDNLILKLLCENVFAGENYWVNVEQLPALAEAAGIKWDQFLESISVLAQHNFLEITEADGGYIVFLKLTPHAFEEYAQACIPNYQELKIALIGQMLQDGGARSNKDLASRLQQSLMLCNHILHHLASQELIKINEMLGGSIHVWNVSPELHRAFRNDAIETFLKKKGA